MSPPPPPQICVNAVMAVADFDRKDVNFDLIKVDGKPGGELGDTELIKGIVIDKVSMHVQISSTHRS
jgi:T-complex protein 1 subunit epsilon